MKGLVQTLSLSFLLTFSSLSFAVSEDAIQEFFAPEEKSSAAEGTEEGEATEDAPKFVEDPEMEQKLKDFIAKGFDSSNISQLESVLSEDFALYETSLDNAPKFDKQTYIDEINRNLV
uniref:hypothetical protein n=1 Tax=Thaumasiovibrio occultus TaxID=1891184 RepID=UPI00131CBE0A